MIDSHPHLTLFLSIWAAAGPLAGILIGHLLTQYWQRRQWLLDCRKEEFKELVSALTAATVAHIHHKVDLRSSNPAQTVARRDALDEFHDAALRALGDRIYIHGDITELNARLRYLDAIQSLRTGDLTASGTKKLSDLLREIIIRARKG